MSETQVSTPEHPRFISTKSEPVPVALLSGHSISVTNEPEGTPLHPRFHKVAILKGAVPLAMHKAIKANDETSMAALSPPDRLEVITSVIAQLVAEATENPERVQALFTTDGRPAVDALSQRAGFKVAAGERDEAWAKYESGSED